MEKSIAMATSVMIQAKQPTSAPRIEPTTPAPMLKRKAMNAIPQAMGWSTMALVSPSTESWAEVLNEVPSASVMMLAAWYPTLLDEQ